MPKTRPKKQPKSPSPKIYITEDIKQIIINLYGLLNTILLATQDSIGRKQEKPLGKVEEVEEALWLLVENIKEPLREVHQFYREFWFPGDYCEALITLDEHIEDLKDLANDLTIPSELVDYGDLIAKEWDGLKTLTTRELEAGVTDILDHYMVVVAAENANSTTANVKKVHELPEIPSLTRNGGSAVTTVVDEGEIDKHGLPPRARRQYGSTDLEYLH